MNFKFIPIVFLFLFSLSVEASFKGRVSFSNSLVEKHKSSINQMTAISAACLQRYKRNHLSFFNSTCRQTSRGRICLSKYFGDRRYSKTKRARRSDGQRLEYLGRALKNLGFSRNYMNQMESISCVGMALKCLEEGLIKTDQQRAWKKINKFASKNSYDGSSVQHALQKLGWTIMYWNPSQSIVADTQQWDRQERRWASKGYHYYRYQTVMNSRVYWNNKVDDVTSLVGFGNGEPYVLKTAPFWIGTAHTGYHVFPGTFSEVVEAHSTKHISSIQNLEFSNFSPFSPGGGPRWSATQKYRSGLIAVPPM